MSEPERDHRYIDARLEHVHGGGVSDRVRGDVAACELGTAGGGDRASELEAIGHGRSCHMPA